MVAICLLPFLLLRPLPCARRRPPPTRGIPASGSRLTRPSVGGVVCPRAESPASGRAAAVGLEGKGRGGGTAAPSHSGGAQGAEVLKREPERETEHKRGGCEHEWGGACPRAPAPLVPPRSSGAAAGAVGPGARSAPLPRAFLSYSGLPGHREAGTRGRGTPPSAGAVGGADPRQGEQPTGARRRVWDAVGSAEGWLGAAESSRLGLGLLGDRPCAAREGLEASRQEIGSREGAAASLPSLSGGKQGI